MIDTDQKIVTRKEAQALGLTRYFTGKPCIYGHLAQRMTGSKTCCECNRIRRKEHHDANREESRRKGREHYAANSERLRETRRAYGKANLEKEVAYNARWRAANPDKAREFWKRDREKNKEARNESTRAWRKRNVEKQNFYSAKRHAMKRDQVPVIRDDLVPIMQAETLAIYAESRTMTELTGVRHDVDHIFPLSKGGVHAPWNLRVLLGSENQSKKDKWPKGEPTHVMWHGELMSRLIG